MFREVDTVRLNQLRCLHSVDIAVRDILSKLADQGKLENTLILYYSDNGYLWGEHRLTRKNRVYEEASHDTLAIRYPPLIPKRRTEDRLVGVIDLAPTIYELANIPIPPDVDGRSLVPLMRGTGAWRNAILLEGWPGSTHVGGGFDPNQSLPLGLGVFRRLAHLAVHKLSSLTQELSNPGEDEEGGGRTSGTAMFSPTRQDYEAIRTDDHVYIETKDDKPELYDLTEDPYQMHNLVEQPNYTDLLEQLKYRLHNDKL